MQTRAGPTTTQSSPAQAPRPYKLPNRIVQVTLPGSGPSGQAATAAYDEPLRGRPVPLGSSLLPEQVILVQAPSHLRFTLLKTLMRDLAERDKLCSANCWGNFSVLVSLHRARPAAWQGVIGAAAASAAQQDWRCLAHCPARA